MTTLDAVTELIQRRFELFGGKGDAGVRVLRPKAVWQCDDCHATGTIETNGDPWKAGVDAQRDHDGKGECRSQRVWPVTD